MRYIHTKLEDYNKFIKENGTNRLSKNLKIHTSSKNLLLKSLFNVNEMFDRILKTDYIIKPNTKYLILFKTNKNNEYRLDVVPKYENDKGLVNHIAFTDSKVNKIEDYDVLLDKNEMIEILNRISYIINDLVIKNIINNYFCIGGTNLESKNKIYEYLLKVVVDQNGFTKETTNLYDAGWGLYFKADVSKNQQYYKNTNMDNH